MHIYVNGRNIEITDAIKAYVKKTLRLQASMLQKFPAK